MATSRELTQLVEQGYLERPGLLDEEQVALARERVDELTDAELAQAGAHPIPGNGYYVRDLIDKDEHFHRYLRFEPTLSIARAVLGPQVWLRTESRTAFEEVEDASVIWHIHMPVIPDPTPPFFSPPHQVHFLIYLDDVGPEEGPLELIPGSHLDPTLTRARVEALDGAVELSPSAGDCLVLHGNLWHRTRPSSARCARRRLLFLGYGPAWLRGQRRPVPGQPSHAGPRLSDDLMADADAETGELLERFLW
jgi:hypothetical protein